MKKAYFLLVLGLLVNIAVAAWNHYAGRHELALVSTFFLGYSIGYLHHSWIQIRRDRRRMDRELARWVVRIKQDSSSY